MITEWVNFQLAQTQEGDLFFGYRPGCSNIIPVSRLAGDIYLNASRAAHDFSKMIPV